MVNSQTFTLEYDAQYLYHKVKNKIKCEVCLEVC